MDDFMSGRHSSRIIWHRSHRIAGSPASIDAAVFVGEVVFRNGERGTYIGSETVGTTHDPDAFSGNAIIVLSDGSVSNQIFEGKTEAIKGPDRFAGTGTWRMERGTGRFADLKGSGSFKWTMTGDEYEDHFQHD
ncbi:MAG TPA: hypothetical protein VFZ03_04640 [Dongiaceae bacterium]